MLAKGHEKPVCKSKGDYRIECFEVCKCGFKASGGIWDQLQSAWEQTACKHSLVNPTLRAAATHPLGLTSPAIIYLLHVDIIFSCVLKNAWKLETSLVCGCTRMYMWLCLGWAHITSRSQPLVMRRALHNHCYLIKQTQKWLLFKNFYWLIIKPLSCSNGDLPHSDQVIRVASKQGLWDKNWVSDNIQQLSIRGGGYTWDLGCMRHV